MKITKTKFNDYKYIIKGEYGYSTFEIDENNMLRLTMNNQTFTKELQVELTLPRIRKTTIEKYVSEFYQSVKDRATRIETSTCNGQKVSTVSSGIFQGTSFGWFGD